MTQPLPLRTRRQFILSNNKWLVRTVPLRRRELILRELCHRCFVQGQKAVLDDFFGTGDSDAAGVDNNDLEHCESSVITENDEEAAAAAVEADIIDAPIEQPSQDHTNDGSSNNTALISELYPNAPCLHIGSNAKTWFDFGADEYNVVGSRHCLPVIISAPGSSESFEEDEVDLALYFDVEISCGSNNELGVSLEADCADAISLISSNLQFTIKEGECQVVYIVWSPSCQGGLRQSIFVKTTFNGTSDLVADDEIVAVGSARKSAIDMITEVHEGVHHANMHHVDLAHSTLDDMSSTEQINEIKGSDEHAPSFIGEEDSQHDVEQNFSIEEERHGAYTKSDQPEQHSSDQTQNGQPHEKAASVNVKPMENGSKEKSGVVTLSFNLKSGLNITSSTTHSNQQLHSSIQNRMSRIRAQRATTSNARDSRGRPIRQTHPSVAVNFAGLSNRAKLMRYNRMLAANKQKEAADESKQTNDSSNEKVEAAEKKDALADGEDAQFEVEDDVTKQAHEKDEHRCGVLLLSPLSETAEFKNIGEEAEHRGAVLLQTPPNTQEASRAQQESGENEANSTIITNSSDADDRDECVEHRFDSPNTKTMLQTMVNVSVEVDESKLTANLSATEDLEVQHAASAESLADEISDMKDYLSPRDQHPVSNESAMDVSMIDVSIDEPENAVKPEIFTFGDNSSPPKSNQKGDENVNDEQMTSPDTLRLSKSYENTTNELDDLIDKNQQKSTKQSITPLQDLHDKINHIINTQKAVSPVNKKNVDITPEPDHIVPLKIKGPTLVMPPSYSTTSHKHPSSKPKTPSSIIRSSLYTDISTQQSDQSSGSSAKKSARQLYFYKSPRNADTIYATKSKTSVSLESGEPKTSTKSDDDVPTLSHQQSKDVVNIAQEFQETVSHKTSNEGSSVPLDPNRTKPQARRADSGGHYKSQMENRSRVSLSTETAEGADDASKVSHEAKTHPRPTAKNEARKLYFFKSPSSEPLSGDGAKVREHRASEPAKIDFRSNGTPSSSSIKPKSLILKSPPAPSLSTRERIAIDKHIHSMKKDASRNSIP